MGHGDEITTDLIEIQTHGSVLRIQAKLLEIGQQLGRMEAMLETLYRRVDEVSKRFGL